MSIQHRKLKNIYQASKLNEYRSSIFGNYPAELYLKEA